MLNTSRLLEAVLEEISTEISIDDLRRTTTVYSRSYFYDTLIKRKNDPRATARALDKSSHGITLDRKAYERAYQFPAIEHPTIQKDPTTGEEVLYVDELRSRRINGITSRLSDLVLRTAVALMNGNPEIRYTHHWEEGDVIAFPHVGTLHRSEPGNQGTRTIGRALISSKRN